MKEWQHCHVQESAQELIAHLLHHKARERMTADEALSHPWLAQVSNLSAQHMELATDRLLTQQVRRKLRRAVTKLNVIDHWSFMLSADASGASLQHKINRLQNGESEDGCKCTLQ